MLDTNVRDPPCGPRPGGRSYVRQNVDSTRRQGRLVVSL